MELPATIFKKRLPAEELSDVTADCAARLRELRHRATDHTLGGDKSSDDQDPSHPNGLRVR
jgi:hypothetical protein